MPTRFVEFHNSPVIRLFQEIIGLLSRLQDSYQEITALLSRDYKTLFKRLQDSYKSPINLLSRDYKTPVNRSQDS